MTSSISEQCRACVRSLREAISALSKPGSTAEHVKQALVDEELDRFILFVGDIGGFHEPESPMSVDSRLSEAKDVLDHLSCLLDDLNEAAEELNQVIFGERQGMTCVSDENEDGKEMRTREELELRAEIRATITRLFRVATLVRQAAPTDPFIKAVSQNRDRSSVQYDIAHVGQRYPNLDTEDRARLRQLPGRASASTFSSERRHDDLMPNGWVASQSERTVVLSSTNESSLGDVKLRLGGGILQRSRVNYEDSVDIERPVCVDQIANSKWKDGQFCWEAKGQCAQDYEEVKAKLLRELDQSRQESFCEVGVSLYMIGKTPRKAKPMIIISSEDKRSREEAKRAITRSGVLADLGFEIGVLKYLPSGPTHPVAGSTSEACWDSASESEGWDLDIQKETTHDLLSHSSAAISSSVYYDPQRGLRLTGMPIYVKKADGRSRMGTANLVYNGSKYGYMTVAHIFDPLHQNPSSIDDEEDNLGIPFDSDSDDEDDEDGEDGLKKNPLFAGGLLSDSVVSRKSYVFHGDEFGTGGATGISIDLPYSLALLGELEFDQKPDKSLDYAIITINDPRLQRNLHRYRILKGRDDSDLSSSTAEPRPSMATTWTTHGLIHGTLNKVPVFMCLPGSKSFQSVYTFAYEGAIKHGDCGSLVLDNNRRGLYGMIIAAADKQNLAYIVAAKELVDHISNAGWQLLDVDYDYISTSDINDEIPRSPAEHGPRTVSSSVGRSQNMLLQPRNPEPVSPTKDFQTDSWPTRILGAE